MTPPTPLESQEASNEQATSVTEQFNSLAITGMLDTYASILDMTEYRGSRQDTNNTMADLSASR